MMQKHRSENHCGVVCYIGYAADGQEGNARGERRICRSRCCASTCGFDFVPPCHSERSASGVELRSSARQSRAESRRDSAQDDQRGCFYSRRRAQRPAPTTIPQSSSSTNPAVAITDRFPLWLKTCHRHVFLTRRARLHKGALRSVGDSAPYCVP